MVGLWRRSDCVSAQNLSDWMAFKATVLVDNDLRPCERKANTPKGIVASASQTISAITPYATVNAALHQAKQQTCITRSVIAFELKQESDRGGRTFR